MRRVSWFHLLASTVALVVVGVGCGDKKKDNNNKGGPNSGPGPMDNKNPSGCTPQGCPQPALNLTVDVQGALGLMVVDDSPGGAQLALTQHNDTRERLGLWEAPKFSLSDVPAFGLAEGGGSEDGGLKKVDGNGEVVSAIRQEKQEVTNGPMPQPLPGIRTIAVSKRKEIYLHFERPFNYKPVPPGVDNGMSSGYQCQIFKVTGGSLDDLIGKAPSLNNIECLDNQHFIDSWQSQRNSVFQFDDNDNLYYPGSLPEAGGKMVVYKRNAETGQIQELINSNIQVNDFVVTPNGSVFYTGQTNTNGKGGGGQGGFFRFISANNDLIEIARNWWNFIFEPLNETGSDKAIFFGPDPSVATTASWNTACLFKFDPQADNNSRSSALITCGGDIWRWVNMDRPEDKANADFWPRNITGKNMEKATFKTEYKRRCESDGDVFAGGGSQISAVKQAGNETYVIGNVRKKKAGKYTCNLAVKGPHCVISDVPYLRDKDDGTTLYTSATCAQDAGQWVEKNPRCSVDTSAGWRSLDGVTSQSACITVDQSQANSPIDCRRWDTPCTINHIYWEFQEVVNYNGVASSACTESSDSLVVENLWDNGNPLSAVKTESAVTELTAKINPGWSQCEAPASNGGDAWTDELSALAKVNSTSKGLDLLSLGRDQAINVWTIGSEVFYSAYNVDLGQYVLRKIVNGQPVLVKANFETYQLSKSPVNGKAYINGLDFSANQFVFGTINTAPDGEGKFALDLKAGVTGQVRTIIVIDE